MTTTIPASLLTDHFTWEETVHSDAAIHAGLDNTPTIAAQQNIVRTATKMEKVRELLDKSIIVHSWYRNAAVNKLVGGVPDSQHTEGKAVDFVSPDFGTCLDICKLIIANKELINYDQLILEHSWVHISFEIPNVAPRHQVLSLLATGHYASGLTDIHGNPL